MLSSWKEQNPDKIVKLLKYYTQVLPADNMALLELQVEAYQSCRMWPETTESLKKLLAQKDKLSEAKRIDKEIIFAILTAENGKSVARNLTDLYKAAADEKYHKQDRIAEALKNYARFALSISKEDMARALWDARNAMILSLPKPTLKVPFVQNGPKDIAEFMASDYIKNPENIGVLDRKFGNNLQFLLETDSAITGRTVTAGDANNKNFTTFTATCDEEGVRLFFMMPTTKENVEKMRLGYGGFGGFETYLATGFDQPYTCLLIDCPPNMGVYDTFVTMYDNRFYQRALASKKNIAYDFKLVGDQVLLLITVDWTAVANGIPENGSKWEFEPIHWEKGGYSWGGSESVHNRSSYGQLIFDNMTPENVTKIKRRLLSFAKKAYNRENSSRDGGLLEHW